MASNSSNLFIALGTPTVVVTTLNILSIGQDGDPSALRILTHPDAANFAPITYQRNPDIYTNLDNEVIFGPDGKIEKALESSVLVSFDNTIDDVVVEETWAAQSGRVASMGTFFFRELLQYYKNPPALNPSNQTYITWQPRDRSLKTYNVQLFDMKAGAGAGVNAFTVTEVRPASGAIRNPVDELDVAPTGLVDQTVKIFLKIISEV